MTALDDILIPAALEIITEFGKVMTYIELKSSEHQDDGGVVEVKTEHTLTASPPFSYTDEQATALGVRSGSVQVFFAASGLAFAPDADAIIQIDGVEWIVAKVIKHYSGEQVALFELPLER